MARLGLLALAALAAGCHPVLKLDLPKLPKVCADGWPVKLLLDPHCYEGVCGWTCGPDRWQPRPAEGGK